MSDIVAYFHCEICLAGRLAVGWTKLGLQVWCDNYEKNIINLDFKGQKLEEIRK